MNVTTKTVTTRTHTAAFSADEIKAVVTSTAIKALGLSDSAPPATVTIAGDGSVSVEVVEQVIEAAAPASDPSKVDAPPAATPGATSTPTAPAATTSGSFHFPKAS